MPSYIFQAHIARHFHGRNDENLEYFYFHLNKTRVDLRTIEIMRANYGANFWCLFQTSNFSHFRDTCGTHSTHTVSTYKPPLTQFPHINLISHSDAHGEISFEFC